MTPPHFLRGALSLLFLTIPSQALWLGDPAEPARRSTIPFQINHAVGSMKLDHNITDHETRLHYFKTELQAFWAAHPSVEIFGRITPWMGRINFENGDFAPRMLGLGAGLRWARRNADGPWKTGVIAAWDWNYAYQLKPVYDRSQDGWLTDFNPVKNDRVNWVDVTLAPGVSYDFSPRLHAYAGPTLSFSKIYTKIGTTRERWNGDSPFGAFAGLRGNWKRLHMTLEGRFFHEESAAASVKYLFGKKR